ncbi:MAG: zinc ribbon domain-containing protein [Coriobacteriia bacterium]|nr:zinc ribbon domain-containing protein [Coriobacteriia bacterium]MDP2299602.1 zinc ribbon domain-containing protein [Actinomycetota bacterium]MDZ4167194.1 zinc ribbon domain-containing protein [Coriobacteriia bacterium]
MPTYELHCTECGHRFDRFLTRFIREADKVCPECGSTKVHSGVGGGFVALPSRSGGSCAPRGGFS